MSGTPGPPPLTGIGPVDDLARKVAALQATVDGLQAAASGPLRDWPYTRDSDGRPAVVSPTGDLHGLLSTTTNGRTLDEVAAVADAAASRSLPPGWVFIDQGDGVLRVQDRSGRVFVMQETIQGWPAPVWVFGDSNSVQTSSVVPGLTTWPTLLSTSILNGAVNGRGYSFVAAGQRSIEADIRATRQPFGTAILNCGINDISQGVAMGTIQAAIVSAMGYAERLAQRVLITTVLPTTGGFAGLNTNRVTLNTWIKATWASQLPRGYALDVASAVEATPDGALTAAYSYDGLHLNQSGQSAVAEFLRSQVGL